MTDQIDDKDKEEYFIVDEQSCRDGDNYIKQLTDISSKNAEALDKLIITLSSAFLAMSISFIDKIVPLSSACCKYLLILAWSSFVLSIILNVVSFFIANHECNLRKKAAREYYYKGSYKARDKLCNESSITHLLNIFTAASYVIGTILLTLFVSINIYRKGADDMSDKKQVSKPVIKKEIRTDSADSQIRDRKVITEERKVQGAVPPGPPIDRTTTNRDKTK